MLRISEYETGAKRTSSPCLPVSVDDSLHDSAISLASDLSTSYTNSGNGQILCSFDKFSQEFSSGEDPVSLEDDHTYESISNVFSIGDEKDSLEGVQYDYNLDSPTRHKEQQSDLSEESETPKARSKRVRWPRPFQNTVNFQLDSSKDSNCFRKGQRRIRKIMKRIQKNPSSSGVKVTSIRHISEDAITAPYNLEDVSLWPADSLPESLHVDYSLETLEKPKVQSAAFKSISSHEMGRIMETMSSEIFAKKFIIVDCRYPYEYNGGHVKGAVNVWNWKTLKSTFYPDCPAKFKVVSSKIPIFYCEFSQKRGPQLAEALRKYDRKRNEWRYPEVDYKEVYLLDGGYKKFYEDNYTHLCEPPSYVTMLATPYRQDLKRFHMHRSKSAIELNAAISGAFDNAEYVNYGWVRHNSCLLSSPTQFSHAPNLLSFIDETALAPNLANTLRLSESPEPAH